MVNILSVHVPLTVETRHLIDAEAISKLPQGAYIVNTARGPVVDESALAEALEAGHLGGAGLDVVEREPYPDPRLIAAPNCLITPHSAFYSEDSWREMRAISARCILSVLHDRAPRNVINGFAGAHLRNRPEADRKCAVSIAKGDCV